MSLTILSDKDVKGLLGNLTADDFNDLQKSMRQALHQYSTGTQEEDICALHQPKRTVLESKNGTTTLFMPSTSSQSIGMKVVTLATPNSKKSPGTAESPITTPQGAITLMSNTGKPTGFINAEEITAFRTALASSLLIKRRKKVKVLTVFGAGKQAYWHIRLSLLLRGSTIKTVNIINRTWNDRVAELMKSFLEIDPDMKEKEGWSQTKFSILTPGYVEFSRLEKERLRAADVIICTTPSTETLFDHQILTNTEGRKRGRLIIAIGSYKPHMIELPTELLDQAVKTHGSGHHFHKHAEEGGVIVVDTLDGCIHEAGEIIQAKIHPTQLVEIGELVLLAELEALEASESEASSVIDDSPVESFDNLVVPERSGARSLARAFGGGGGGSRNNSESPSRPSRPSLSHSRKSSYRLDKHNRTGSSSSLSLGKKPSPQSAKDDHMSRWLCSGNVIYKSVGMGLMDLVVGGELVRLAREKGVGVTVEGF